MATAIPLDGGYLVASAVDNPFDDCADPDLPGPPRVGSTGEDDGYLVTFTIDMVEDRSQALVFDASRVGDGPIARVTLPERISSGTHSTWAPGSALPGWDAA